MSELINDTLNNPNCLTVGRRNHDTLTILVANYVDCNGDEQLAESKVKEILKRIKTPEKKDAFLENKEIIESYLPRWWKQKGKQMVTII